MSKKQSLPVCRVAFRFKLPASEALKFIVELLLLLASHTLHLGCSFLLSTLLLNQLILKLVNFLLCNKPNSSIRGLSVTL